MGRRLAAISPDECQTFVTVRWGGKLCAIQSKRADRSPDGKQSVPPMDIYNTRRTTVCFLIKKRVYLKRNRNCPGRHHREEQLNYAVRKNLLQKMSSASRESSSERSQRLASQNVRTSRARARETSAERAQRF
uniref:SFRICE_037072 n=1 Tax=Spodoptera frugiperda TaxID=7108 RepID=A0A2H1X0G4_SPOFR